MIFSNSLILEGTGVLYLWLYRGDLDTCLILSLTLMSCSILSDFYWSDFKTYFMFLFVFLNS